MKKTAALIIGCIMLVGTSTITYAEEYKIKPGDVLWKIAAENNTTIDELVELNDIKNPNLIYAGETIQLPQEREETTMRNAEKVKLTNSEKAVALLNSIESGDSAPVAFINPEKYIQHNLSVKDGLAGFGELMSQLPKGSARVNVKRVFTDGDYVFVHTEYNFFGPKIGFDIFRFEDGLIVEHWDNLMPVAEDVNPAGRSQIDGTTVLKDIDKTEANKAIVKGFVADILMGGAPEKLTNYISSETYFQHNTGVADGIDGLGEALAAMAEAGTPMIYTENHFVLGEGNFVLAASEGKFLGKNVSFYDLFRIEDGLIVEHWDVIEEIPASDEWMNDNGKF